MEKCLLVSVLFVFACGAGAEPQASNNPTTNAGVHWSLVLPTMQLVQDATDGAECASGWSLQRDALFETNEGERVPIQPRYVRRFRTVNELGDAIVQTYIELPPLRRAFPTVRVALSWPCWMQSAAWRESFVAMTEKITAAGIGLELTLSHHDSFPSELWQPQNGPGMLRSGWSHPNAPAAFEQYAQSVRRQLAHVILPGTLVYLVNEPTGMLFNSFLGEGAWPPGGKRAGKSFAAAMQNMRDGLMRASAVLSDTGWTLAVAHNIRPMHNHDHKLDLVFNWWMPDALHLGCVDNDFDGVCERMQESAHMDTFGVTFYGSMWPSEEDVELNNGERMKLPAMDFQPSVEQFEHALESAQTRYPETHIVLSEIGFSSGDTARQGQWLANYEEVLTKANVLDAGLHTLFQAAEFAPGEWFFHIADGCGGAPCRLTAWGKQAVAAAGR